MEISSAILLRAMRSVSVATLTAAGDYEIWERCGILRGRGQTVTRLDQTANVAPDPTRAFEIDPAALIDAYKRQRKRGGLEVLGYFHTHPSGSCAPSPRDAEGASPDDKLWLIASNEGVLLWRAVPDGALHGRFDRVVFDIRIGSRVEKGCPGVAWRGLELEYLVKMELEAGGML